MFPTYGSVIIRNEAGEPLGWDYPDRFEPDSNDPYDDYHEQQLRCKCGHRMWEDDEEAILAHGEVCDEVRKKFPDVFDDQEEANGNPQGSTEAATHGVR